MATVNDILERVDEKCPNSLSQRAKIHWLEELELQLWDKVYSRHEGKEDVQLFRYESDEQAAGAELSVPDPYSRLYEYSLQCIIHEVNGDIDRYNNARILYEDAYNDFSREWTQEHRPLPWPRFRL